MHILIKLKLEIEQLKNKAKNFTKYKNLFATTSLSKKLINILSIFSTKKITTRKIYHKIRFYNKCINDIYVQCLHGDIENISAYFTVLYIIQQMLSTWSHLNY